MSERANAIERLILSEPAAARITPDLIGEMLQGFALPPLRGLDWLSESIRPLVFVMARTRLPKGNSEIRDELLKLAARARDLHRDIMLTRRDAFYELSAFAYELEEQKENYSASKALKAYSEPENLVLFAEFYETVAGRLDNKSQTTKWRAKARQNWRVWLAVALSPMFEECFGRKAALDKWPAASGNESLGNWADFYQRVMGAAFGEKATPNLEGVLVEARKQVRTGDIRPLNPC